MISIFKEIEVTVVFFYCQADSRKKGLTAGGDDVGNPKCQGCNKHRAQFVCAGCGNQWYCSRECQVSHILVYLFFFLLSVWSI